MKIFNKFDILSYIAFIIAVICFLIPGSKKMHVGIFPLQEIAVYIVAIGCLFTGFTALHSLREGKQVEFNRFMMFSGFGIGGMALLAGLFKFFVYLSFG